MTRRQTSPAQGAARAVIERAGHRPSEIDQLRFAEVDSLLIAELVAVVEEHLGHEIEPEAFDPDTPLLCLLAMLD